ncbi:TRAP transporter large permease [Aestuariirhabdus litorea]|uniref:TRAP transporter large permease subunit n=1 Tax=Aestuariirhabdus litorea TaxID=2528527 RepID=A0A3P3VNR2_9GAMM|nr:TRAP transporter large permease subunit [Aestuariirhabdus litorea]RRJ84250.1 TRAP transporter large permease subunit [Aestuariirhabdus litorea]RWW97472.1 TRAP transporter large permease subunit [Endozoicomonadaceae bacterium GTF-13]
MELVFLAILVLLMVVALTSGFPVAFSLPGSAILSIGLAAACGYLFAGDSSAYFAQGGPVQWLSAGVTNFRSLYWDVERDTLIAIPLFIFMGIMLQRSKIAEDLLVAMAQLFGPVPGGLGISVVLVGALLAATTGIVGATVIAMGLISLPAMLRNNYSHSLATGTICASGTLGQIIPPSIVLIILADQLSSAADQASTIRKQLYKDATGEFSMPSVFDITSASAGDMFMGALIPGLILVGLYVGYILIVALVRPKMAPPVPYEGQYDLKFAKQVFLALMPPLTLIFVVLGSIIMGVATVNQAGAIGAVGAMIMGGYRLTEGKRSSYYPAILAIGSTLVLLVVLSFYTLNIKNIGDNMVGIVIASIAVAGLLFAVGWSAIRAYRIDNTLNEVMVETAKTTSMVFIILIGAAMLTSAFRGFGGEELVKHFLTGLPGGFWTQFIVVMLVIFLLGFFLDFIEIAVVVVPIVAPILLADPEANVTAVWLGVMVGLNIQTSFLTPPFGFALFYLRGVAPKIVKTLSIYKGATAFIGLQLLALVIAGFYPSLVNYLPYRTYLTSENAPPPMNPRLQMCLEEQLFEVYDSEGDRLRSSITRMQETDLSSLPRSWQKSLAESGEKATATFTLVASVREAEANVLNYSTDYAPLHGEVRRLESRIRIVDKQMASWKQTMGRMTREDDPDQAAINRIKDKLEELQQYRDELEAEIPDEWKASRKTFVELQKEEKTARNRYRNNVDNAYEPVMKLRQVLADTDPLIALKAELDGLRSTITSADPEVAMEAIKQAESNLGGVEDSSKIKSPLSKARRALKGDDPDRDKALELYSKAMTLYQAEVEWRQRAREAVGPALAEYDEAIAYSIGLRLQKRMTLEQAKGVARCQSVHRNISLNF